MKWWIDLKCKFGSHPDWKVYETVRVRGFLFGEMCDGHKYQCTNCGFKREEVAVTETLTLN